ncbi:MAG TPA: branched-chain amino acid ABC transporter permease [Acetobacteraceae bacterium]|nr:branched-chain amino acid ABC transporter permease [Acetobacteraceae bacterium]
MNLEALIENVLNALAAGVMIGCIYGLMCIGLGLIFGIMKVVNFAQGELLMLGMFASFYLVTGGGVLAFLGPYIGPFVGALLAGPIVFVGGALMHRFLIARVSGLATSESQDDTHFGQLIITLGISLILQNGGLIVFGSTPLTVRTPLASRAVEIGPIYGDATIFLNKARLIACAVAIIAAVSLYLLLEYTRLGKALRAAADNPTAATYMGIDVNRAYRIAFGLGSGITAIAGGLMATYLSFGPFIGLDYVIIMYSGVVLGGMGSILGAFWGGLTVGFVQQCSSLILPPQLQNAAIFVVFLMIVLLRPQGLFGRSAERA